VLRERGADASTASLFAAVAVAIFRSGFDRWVDAPHDLDLAGCIRQSAEQLSDAAAARSTVRSTG